MKIEVKFLDVFNGDAILLRYLGNDDCYHNIMIDGGFVKTYKSRLKPELNKMLVQGEIIDLLVLSHYDLDHIGGILSFIYDDDFDKKAFVGEWWLNHNIQLLNEDGLVSATQLVSLSSHLKEIERLPANPIIFDKCSLDLSGAKITVLSPDSKSHQKAIAFINGVTTENIGTNVNDYDVKVGDFLNRFTEKEDQSISNGSSIAILFEYKDTRLLFLADAFPSIIVNSLRELGYSSENKLEVDYVKISHHGSKYNLSSELLSIIQTNNYILCANGINKHMLPHKEVFAKILLSEHRIEGDKVNFFFNQKNDTLQGIFTVDGESVFEEYNFNVHFPDEDYLTLTI